MRIKLDWEHFDATQDGSAFWAARLGKTGLSLHLFKSRDGWLVHVVGEQGPEPLYKERYRAETAKDNADIGHIKKAAQCVAADYFSRLGDALIPKP